MARAGERTLSLYVHVPFCAVRCGYCDFNTYTMSQLGPDVSRDDYHHDAAAEVRFGRSVLDAAGAPSRPLHSVFFGGGTPTLLPAENLADVLTQARESFGLAPDAEVTVKPTRIRSRIVRSRSSLMRGLPGCPSGCSPPCRTC
nr:radical SAM protein [Kocuria atrinae]